MAIVPTSDVNKVVASKMSAFTDRVKKAFVAVLTELGYELVAYARDMHDYKDRTGNLTNSMGYAIYQKKSLIKQGGMQGEGAVHSNDVLSLLTDSMNTEYSLVIVAGMNYAAYVEAKGYNVLIPAELKAKTEFVTRMKELIAIADSKLKGMMK